MMRLLFVCCLLLAGQAFANQAQDVYQFDSPVLQQRFQALSEELRCPKCQDQSIGDSESEIAADMRRRTAELLREGKSNEEIVAYFVERYGDFVTFKPPLRWDTALVWGAPLLAFLFGLALVAWQLAKANRRWREKAGADKTEDGSC